MLRDGTQPPAQGVVLSGDWEKLAHYFADQLVELWHTQDFAYRVPPLHEWMGLTEEQYAAWFEGRYGQVFA